MGWEVQGSFLLQTRGGGVGWWLLELGQHLTPLQHPYLRVWDGSLVRERVGDVQLSRVARIPAPTSQPPRVARTGRGHLAVPTDLLAEELVPAVGFKSSGAT